MGQCAVDCLACSIPGYAVRGNLHMNSGEYISSESRSIGLLHVLFP